MAARRRRGLSPEDRRLWQQVTATATPLHAPDEPPAPTPTPTAPLPPPAPGPVARPPRHAVRAPQPPRTSLDLAPDPHADLDRAHPHMDRRRFDKLRRGRLDP
jgi:DNA-nicking Smr family endonuclease